MKNIVDYILFKAKSNRLTFSGKVKAFTLIEIVVVLIITGTVITLAMWAYVNISSYLKTYEDQEAVNQELALFLTHFRMDVDQASTITEKRGTLQLFNENVKEIDYDFLDESILRYSSYYTDTFNLSIADVQYETDPVNDDWINHITLTVQASGLEYPLQFFKCYTNQQKFQAHEY